MQSSSQQHVEPAAASLRSRADVGDDDGNQHKHETPAITRAKEFDAKAFAGKSEAARIAYVWSYFGIDKLTAQTYPPVLPQLLCSTNDDGTRCQRLCRVLWKLQIQKQITSVKKHMISRFLFNNETLYFADPTKIGNIVRDWSKNHIFDVVEKMYTTDFGPAHKPPKRNSGYSSSRFGIARRARHRPQLPHNARIKALIRPPSEKDRIFSSDGKHFCDLMKEYNELEKQWLQARRGNQQQDNLPDLPPCINIIGTPVRFPFQFFDVDLDQDSDLMQLVCDVETLVDKTDTPFPADGNFYAPPTPPPASSTPASLTDAQYADYYRNSATSFVDNKQDPYRVIDSSGCADSSNLQSISSASLTHNDSNCGGAVQQCSSITTRTAVEDCLCDQTAVATSVHHDDECQVHNCCALFTPNSCGAGSTVLSCTPPHLCSSTEYLSSSSSRELPQPYGCSSYSNILQLSEPCDRPHSSIACSRALPTQHSVSTMRSPYKSTITMKEIFSIPNRVRRYDSHNSRRNIPVLNAGQVSLRRLATQTGSPRMAYIYRTKGLPRRNNTNNSVPCNRRSNNNSFDTHLLLASTTRMATRRTTHQLLPSPLLLEASIDEPCKKNIMKSPAIIKRIVNNNEMNVRAVSDKTIPAISAVNDISIATTASSAVEPQQNSARLLFDDVMPGTPEWHGPSDNSGNKITSKSAAPSTPLPQHRQPPKIISSRRRVVMPIPADVSPAATGSSGCASLQDDKSSVDAVAVSVRRPRSYRREQKTPTSNFDYTVMGEVPSTISGFCMDGDPEHSNFSTEFSREAKKENLVRVFSDGDTRQTSEQVSSSSFTSSLLQKQQPAENTMQLSTDDGNVATGEKLAAITTSSADNVQNDFALDNQRSSKTRRRRRRTNTNSSISSIPCPDRKQIALDEDGKLRRQQQMLATISSLTSYASLSDSTGKADDDVSLEVIAERNGGRDSDTASSSQQQKCNMPELISLRSGRKVKPAHPYITGRYQKRYDMDSNNNMNTASLAPLSASATTSLDSQTGNETVCLTSTSLAHGKRQQFRLVPTEKWPQKMSMKRRARYFYQQQQKQKLLLNPAAAAANSDNVTKHHQISDSAVPPTDNLPRNARRVRLYKRPSSPRCFLDLAGELAFEEPPAKLLQPTQPSPPPSPPPPEPQAPPPAEVCAPLPAPAPASPELSGELLEVVREYRLRSVTKVTITPKVRDD